MQKNVTVWRKINSCSVSWRTEHHAGVCYPVDFGFINLPSTSNGGNSSKGCRDDLPGLAVGKYTSTKFTVFTPIRARNRNTCATEQTEILQDGILHHME
jgi:hypothetical protein